LMKQALDSEVLVLVNPHRWRDEIILILKEQDTIKPLKRLSLVVPLSFIDKKIKLSLADFKLLKQVRNSLNFYNHKFFRHRKIDAWLVIWQLF